MIAIVDYGAGNIRSVERAVHAAAQAQGLTAQPICLVREPEELLLADRVLFPGQGAMHDCMASLEASGMRAALLEVIRTRPFFGICVGQQMLLDGSEEGDTPGLGIFSGRVVRITAERGARAANGDALKVPHMGWNSVRFVRDHPVTRGLEARHNGHWFYFVHSFVAYPDQPSDILGQADYGMTLSCALARDNIVATQFHPEKSAEAGLQMLQNFLVWNP